MSAAAVAVVGIDAATDARRTGIAFATWRPGGTHVAAARVGEDRDDLARTAAAWVADSRRWLIAVDAPLGWPVPLGERLAAHRAGQPVGAGSDALFRRYTDIAVRERIGKTPLEVGADRIARTAVSALDLLAAIAKRTGLEVPLAWSPSWPSGGAAIEVYPAGTLRAHGQPSSAYKGSGEKDLERRKQLIRALGRKLTLPQDRKVLREEPDVLDACLCVLAASDFLDGSAPGPEDRALAEREGWIWVRDLPPGSAVRPRARRST